MDNILQYSINLIVFIPIIIILIVVSIKFSKISVGSMGIYKYTKVIERTNLNKDTDVFVLKIGDEGCVLVSSSSKVEKIKELNKEEMIDLEKKKKEISKIKIPRLNKRELELKKLGLSEFQIRELELKKRELKKLELKKLKLKKYAKGE